LYRLRLLQVPLFVILYKRALIILLMNCILFYRHDNDCLHKESETRQRNEKLHQSQLLNHRRVWPKVISVSVYFNEKFLTQKTLFSRPMSPAFQLIVFRKCLIVYPGF